MTDYKGIEGLTLGEAPEPVAREGEEILRVRYAALNPADRYLAERLYPARPTLPHILGRDAVGYPQSGARARRQVVLRGPVGVDRPGTFAERVAVPRENLVDAPEEWSDQEAAGATLVYLTAYQALTMWGPLPERAWVLVTGASGGVGVASVQLATAMGCRVLALSRSAEKGRRLQELGAEAVLDPRAPDWRKQAAQITAPERVDLAVDNIGGRLFSDVLETLGQFGKVSVVGRLAGPVPEFNTASLFFRRLRVGGVAVGSYTNPESREAWAEVLRWLRLRNARPLVDRVFPFEQLREAFARLAAGPMGKVLVEVADFPPG